MNNQLQKILFFYLLLTVFSAFFPQWTSAQTPQPIISCRDDFESQFLKENAQPEQYGVVTADTISPTAITLPSLWWAKEQFDPFAGKLIENWLAYPQEKRVDLVVNWQLWTLLDYLKRYRFINNFGSAIREYHYNLRIFNQQNECLAIYFYNPYRNPPGWEIKFDPSYQESLQIEDNKSQSN